MPVLLRWSALGIRLANLARKEFAPDAPTEAIFSGQYIEAGVSARIRTTSTNE